MASTYNKKTWNLQAKTISLNHNHFIERLFGGIAKARSGCGATLVGDPEQIYQKIRRYMELGFRAFVFSGYPHPTLL